MSYSDPLIDSISAGPDPTALRTAQSSDASSSQHPHESKPPTRRRSAKCFTTLTLPGKYDNEPLATQLWLQSRLQKDGKFAPVGTLRPFTVANTGIQLDLMRLMWPKCKEIIRSQRRRLGPSALIYLLGVVLDGVMSAATLWANSQVLDLVERSFRGSPTSWTKALSVAGLAIGLSFFDSIQGDAISDATGYLQSYVEYAEQRAYLKIQLSLNPQKHRNSLYMAAVDEANVLLAAQVGLNKNYGDVWDRIRVTGKCITTFLQMGTEIAIITRTIMLASPEHRLSPGNVALIGLSLAPTLLTLGREALDSWIDPYADTPETVQLRAAENKSLTLWEIVVDPDKQELYIFGFQDWLLDRWEHFKLIQMKIKREMRGRQSYMSQVLITLEIAVQNGFYVLLATKAVPTTLSLGALTLHRQMAESLLWSLRNFSEHFEIAYQTPFLLAAFFAAQDDPPIQGPQLDYEDHRLSGGLGMRIEARNLSFTYPEAAQPTIHDINLVVEPGECLAIVGFNGGGKTTLVKTLLGLHGHTGGLTVNGHEIDDYDVATLNNRMSCLFQDYQMYEGSLRLNVGLGDATLMDDNDAIATALARGGATAVAEKIGGVEQLLDRWSVPNHYSIMRQSGEEDMGGNNGDKGDDGDDKGDDSEGPLKPLSGSELVVHDDGHALSGGEWQRVALSRAFMRTDKADLVVFDEPSASLDPRAEAELFDKIHSLSMRDGRRVTTTVFISHRFSTVRRADKIAFMENGTITEYGTHAELMALGGQYHDMFELQRSGFEG